MRRAGRPRAGRCIWRKHISDAELAEAYREMLVHRISLAARGLRPADHREPLAWPAGDLRAQRRDRRGGAGGGCLPSGRPEQRGGARRSDRLLLNDESVYDCGLYEEGRGDVRFRAWDDYGRRSGASVLQIGQAPVHDLRRCHRRLPASRSRAAFRAPRAGVHRLLERAPAGSAAGLLAALSLFSYTRSPA